MSVNVGQAVGYLDLDTTKFKKGLTSALADLKTFQSQTATGKDKLAAFSSAATSAGRSLTKGLTVPIAGIGVAATVVTAKFDAGMSKVQAISGATSQEMEKLRAKAKEMGAQTKFSATESAEAFSYMAMAGWKTEDMLDGISGIMDLAAASGEDLATTSDIVTDALTAFGLSAKDSSHFADVLAAASSNANTNVSLMGETFKYVAPVAGALGFSVEDVSTAIGLMANSGIKGSQAGTALRNLFTRMAKPTKQSAKAMKQLGVSLTDSSGQMKDFDTIMDDLRKGFAGLTKAEKAQAAAALSGQYGMSGLLAVVNASDKDFNKLKDAIYNADGASKEMAETMMDNLPGALTLMKSALEGLGIRIGEVIVPTLTKIIKGFTAFISWLSQASDSTVRFAVVLGTVLASIGPILLVMGLLAGSVNNLITAYQNLSKIMAGKSLIAFIKSTAAKIADTAATYANTAANVANKASLSGVTSAISSATAKILAFAAAHKVATIASLGVIGAIIGLAIYMKRTGMTVEELKTKILEMFNNLVKQMPQIMDTVASVATGIVKQIPSIVSHALTSLGTVVRSGLENLKTALPEIAKWWQSDMPQLIAVGSDMIVNIINGFSESLPQLIETGSDMLVQLIDQFFADAPKFIEAGGQIILSLISGMAQAIPQLVTSIGGLISQNLGPILTQVIAVLTAISNALIQNLPIILQSLTVVLLALINAIAQNAPAIIKAALKLMAALAVGLLKALPQIIIAMTKISLAIIKAVLAIAAALVKAGVKILQALWRGINSWAGTLRSKVAGVAKKVLTAIINGLGNLLSIGLKWISSLWDGINSKVGDVISKVTSFAKNLPDKIKSGLGNLYSIGANFIAGLANGALGRINSFINSLKGKLEAAKNLAKKIFKIGSPSKVMFQYGEWIIEGLNNGMDEAFGPMFKNLDSNLNKILDLYRPLKSYDFGISESMDSRLFNRLDNLAVDVNGLEASTGINMPIYMTVSGAENPEEFAGRFVQEVKMRMRTE